MKSIIDGMKYDTELSEIVMENQIDDKTHLTLYQTQKGKFFFCNRTSDGDGVVTERLFVTTIRETKEYLISNNAVDEYEKYFGEVAVAEPTEAELKEADIPIESISKKDDNSTKRDEMQEDNTENEDIQDDFNTVEIHEDTVLEGDEDLESSALLKRESTSELKKPIGIIQKINLLKLMYACGTNDYDTALKLLEKGVVPNDKCIRKVIATSNSTFLKKIIEYSDGFVIDENLLTQVIFSNNLSIFKTLINLEKPSQNILKRLREVANKYKYTSTELYLNTIILEDNNEKISTNEK